MSIKEQILKIASDPRKGKELTEKMILASKNAGAEIIVEVGDKKQIRLVRIAELSK